MITIVDRIKRQMARWMVYSLLPLLGGGWVGVFLSSCDSFLEEHPESQVAEAEAYNSVAKLKNNALLTVYNYIGGSTNSNGLQGTERGVYDLNSMTTDEQIVPTRGGDWYDGGLWYRLFFHQWTPGEGPLKDTWDYLYKVVMICNEGLEHIEDYESDATEAERGTLRTYTAELRAIRAMFYFYLTDLYGRVPLVTDTGQASSEMTLENRSKLFYWIWNELNEALPKLRDDRSQYMTSEYYGRVTADVVYFLLMKLALNAEIYTDDNWTDNVYPKGEDIQLTTYNYYYNTKETNNAWETVKMIYREKLGDSYRLENYYHTNFDVNNENSSENIFIIPMNPLLYSNKYTYFFRSRHYNHGAVLGGASENGPCATVSTMKTFGYGNEFYDMRMDFNFYHGEVYKGYDLIYEDDGKTPLVYHPMAVTQFDLSGTPYEKTAGARIAKYSYDATARDDGRMGNNDIVLFRFADCILMTAEACWRTGDEAQATTLVNQVYHRANMEDGYDHVDESVLLDERLKELMWEGWRRNDLIRFHRFHQPYDLKVDASHEQDGHTTVFPIPADMMVMHPNWQQNPGY